MQDTVYVAYDIIQYILIMYVHTIDSHYYNNSLRDTEN